MKCSKIMAGCINNFKGVGAKSAYPFFIVSWTKLEKLNVKIFTYR